MTAVRRAAFVIAAAVSSLTLARLTAHGQVAVQHQGFVPFSDPPIEYRGPVNDPIARLQARLDAGEASLAYEPAHGYLRSVLSALGVPLSSQTLVFSKTSFQYKKISPQAPRALYFNDDVYVGQVRDGKVLEFVSFDARQGAIFYILDEPRTEHPVFRRAELDCTQCHVAAATRNVPGVLVRSVYPTASGTQAPQTPSFVIGHDTPWGERWGGWYVTAAHATAPHLGNAIAADREHPDRLTPPGAAALRDLSGRFDTTQYLTPDSDIVAHLVLAHQTQMHNLITLTNYRARLALHAAAQRNGGVEPEATALSDAERATYEGPAEELVRYLLFANEAPLDGPVAGTSAFAEEFAARGPRDRKGRSLRAFDLRTRIFRYPCSYLIYSDDFDALPPPAKGYVFRRLHDVLTGRDRSAVFASLSAADRRAVLEILLATKATLPADWKTKPATHASGEQHPGRKE